jgi:hypothetical protein
VTKQPTQQEMLDELILTGSERRDQLALLERHGKRSPDEIKHRRNRVRIYLAGLAWVRELAKGGERDA